MRIFWNNRIDVAGVVITPATENSSYPASNLANEQKTRLYKTLATTAAESVVFDLGSALQNTAFLILNHDTIAGDSQSIQANAADSWGAPSYDQALTHDAGIIAEIISETYRYWRYVLTKTAAAQIRSIGRIFLGTYYDTTIQPDWDGYARDVQDNSISRATVSGQRYSLSQPSPRAFALKFSGLSTSERNSLLTIINAVGTHTAFFVQVDPNAPIGDELEEIIHVKFRVHPEFSADGVDASDEVAWASTFELIEAL